MDTNEGSGNPAEHGDRDRVASIGTDRADWGQFLTAHRDRLRRMVALRLDQRLRGRIDPSDVIQEAFLEATERRPEYARQSDPMPPFLWLRFLTLQRLQIVHRQQLGTKSRDAGRDVSINTATYPPASSAALAAQLLGRDTRASEVAIRAERKRRLLEVLERMEAIDREVLVLRHFEQLTNGECARVLGLGESAATKRYLRALGRLKDILSTLPDGRKETWS
jgi:RNA polymerase sigma-70 factor, ECF subfamily